MVRNRGFYRMNVLASFRVTHEVIEWLMVVLNAAAGIWALQAHRNKLFRISTLSWVTAIAQIMVIAHLFSGVALASSENIEVPKFHLLYWSAAALSVGVIYGYRNHPGDQASRVESEVLQQLCE